MPKLIYDKIEKKIIGNSPYEDLGEFCRENTISLFCPNCYEREKVNIPQGKRVYPYRHLWENMKRIQYGYNNRTAEIVSQCSKCGYTLKEITIHRAPIKRRTIKMIKTWIEICINSSQEQLKSKDMEYCGEEYRAEVEGYLRAYKEMKNYIYGRDK